MANWRQQYMKKQSLFMKNKAGIGFSIALLLFNQGIVQADTYSDKTQWLRSSLAQTSQSKNGLIALKALSAKQDVLPKDNSIIVSCSDDPNHAVKLRPFMANRKLPTRRELELALVEQKAKLAEENNSRLNGQISTFVIDRGSIQNRSFGNTRTSAPHRAISHLNNNLSGTHQITKKSNQSNFSFMKQAEQQLLSTGKSETVKSNSLITNSGMNPSVISAVQMQRPVSSSVLPVPSNNLFTSVPPNTASSGLPTAGSSEIPSDNSGPSPFSLPRPTANVHNQISAGFGSAGPPPFPLNLLPEASLKQLIRSLAGQRYRNTSQQVAFGSWHSAAPLQSVSTGKNKGLPYGGFQSHLPQRLTHSAKHNKYGKLYALNTVTGVRNKQQIRKTRSNTTVQKDIDSRPMAREVKVAVYPSAYATQSLKLWNFAQ